MKLLDIDALTPSTYNPRTADPRRLDLIELSLRKLGFLLPIYATPDGEIISGHQRHHVAKRLGVKQVPVEFTRAMDLEERKGVNVAFNRATNDLRPKDTPENITDALKRVDIEAIASAIPDKMPDTPEFYPCMKAQIMPIAPLLKANKGRWITYAASISKTLYLKGVLMPIVTTKDLRVVNGIGRLQMQAESKRKEVAVVLVGDDEAKLAEVTLKNGQFIAEVRGLAQKLSQNIVELYSPTCRAVFGDARCKTNLTSYTVGGSVNIITSRQVFISNSMTQDVGYFSGGEIQFLTGANTGRRMEIKEFSNKQFTLVLPMPNNIAIGDIFNAIAGCDKTITTCASKFNNAVNFRGEPYVPGMDKILATASTQN